MELNPDMPTSVETLSPSAVASRPLRIGIDARTLSGPFTGDRTYWRGLIGGLAKIDSVNRYFIYTREPVAGTPPETGPNFTWRTARTPGNDALWMQFQFPRLLAQDDVDIGHTQYNIPLLTIPCPIVTTIGDITFALFPDQFLPRDRFILNQFIPRSLRKAAGILAVSESTRRDILRRYKHIIAPEKVVTTLLAAHEQFRPIPEAEFTEMQARVCENAGIPRTPYILSVGVLQPRKNLTTLLDAFALVKLGKLAPPHKLFIAGKRGWLNEDLDKQLAALPTEVAKDILFLGYVPDHELPDLYAGAEMFCYPSTYEGFGLPPLEAMACGCPVLCSETSSLPEVVGDGGILLPSKDSDAWARAIEKLIERPELRPRWGERGVARAAQFSWTNTAQKTLETYIELRRPVTDAS